MLDYIVDKDYITEYLKIVDQDTLLLKCNSYFARK